MADLTLVIELENDEKRKVELYRNERGDFVFRVIQLPSVGACGEARVEELWLKTAEIRKVNQLSTETLFGGEKEELQSGQEPKQHQNNR